jgi:Glycosyl hydrolase family 71
MKFLGFLTWFLGVMASRTEAKAVFAHFMVVTIHARLLNVTDSKQVGNAQNYTSGDWQTDMQLAKAAHIDAFALNVAYNDSTIYSSLQLAFAAAHTVGFEVFFSFDFAGGGPWDYYSLLSLCTQYLGHPQYFIYNGAPLVSTFEGPDQAELWTYLKKEIPMFFIPDWSSLGATPAMAKASGVADGLFSVSLFVKLFHFPCSLKVTRHRDFQGLPVFFCILLISLSLCSNTVN